MRDRRARFEAFEQRVHERLTLTEARIEAQSSGPARRLAEGGSNCTSAFGRAGACVFSKEGVRRKVKGGQR